MSKKQIDGIIGSLKEQCQQTGEGYYTLDLGHGVPIRIFLNEKLFAESEEGLYQQLYNVTPISGVLEVVVTPDAHVGSTVPVGCVIATDGTLLHSPVGYDIGCGILCFKSEVPHTKGLDEKLRRKFSEQVMHRIGLGVGQRGKISVTGKQFQEIIRRGADAVGYARENSERDFLPVDDDWDAPVRAFDKGIGQLGSLGGGNHFAELQYDQDGHLWVMVHTGSRGFGYQLAHHYMGLARDEMKARGKSGHWLEATYFLPDSPHWRGYKNAVAAGANFAIANRLYLWEQIGTAFRRVFGQEPELVYEISHNLAQWETLPDGRGAWVHRKGATRAFPAGHPDLAGTKWEKTGHPVLIPGSMGDKSYVLMPKPGAAKSLYSVNHGCGRRMSRGEARQRLTQSGVNRQMKSLNVMVNGGGDVPIDESPDVYKPAKDVIAAVVDAGLAEVVTELSPIASIKGVD
ncbi:MAG TPA: RtcB family protein [Armatimonadaceae bacterium]|nr:RtcB family protein [Armatimonadaceae bacterium]